MPQPEIRTSDLTSEILKFMSLINIQTIKKLKVMLNDFIEPPLETYIIDSLDRLTQLKLINNVQISELGLIIASLNNSPENGLALYAGYKFNCLREVSAIISMLEAMKNKLDELIKQPLFNKEINKKFMEAKKRLLIKSGDHLSLLNIYHHYIKLIKNKKLDKLENWLYTNFIKKKTLDSARRNYYRIYDVSLKLFEKHNVIKSNNFDVDIEIRILSALYCGYNNNKATLNNNNRYDTPNMSNISIDSHSFLSGTTPKTVFYNETFTGIQGKSQLMLVSKIPENSVQI
jgi:HrpA-like RNA helicase